MPKFQLARNIREVFTDQDVLKISRVGSGRVGSGREVFHISRIAPSSGQQIFESHESAGLVSLNQPDPQGRDPTKKECPGRKQLRLSLPPLRARISNVPPVVTMDFPKN